MDFHPSVLSKGRLVAEILLQWFATNKRHFPWRGVNSPYLIAVAEILLQKTSAINALPVYKKLIQKYPTVDDLAQASLSALETLLQPLGLPRRALLLYNLASEIVFKRNGLFPSEERELRKLPGLGPYGAGAVASQAFNVRAPMIDRNVMRIFARVFSIESNLRSAPSKTLRHAVLDITPHGREVDFNLALLDFGALVCRTRAPLCDKCPLANLCDYNLAMSQINV